MSITLPSEGALQLPEVPASIAKSNKELYEYLKMAQRVTVSSVRGAFNNTFTVATAVNSGVSGTFVISSGGSITVVNGIVTVVTS